MRAQVTVTLASAALACAPALWQVAAYNATAVVEALHRPRRRGTAEPGVALDRATEDCSLFAALTGRL